MTAANLHHTEIESAAGAAARWIYLLHGIYGSGRNWGSLARRLVEIRPEWGVVLVDLRLHGASTDLAPPHTVQASADDVRRLERTLGLPASAILGHSFGGKVALVRLAMGDNGEMEQVWVADSTLRVGEPSGSAWRVIEVVRGMPERFESRDEVADGLAAAGYDPGVGQWLAMNLERAEGGFRWRLDWDGVEEMLRDYFQTDVWDVIESPPGSTELHIIRARKSDSIDPESAARIEAAGGSTDASHLHVVDAGHWLNVDNPEAVLDLLATQLPAE